MALNLKKIVALKAKHREHADAFNMVLIAGLSKQRAKIYEFLTYRSADSATITVRFNVSHYYASIVLKNMYDLTLISRKCVVDQHGRRFIYSAQFHDK